jgi:hypothetical protein
MKGWILNELCDLQIMGIEEEELHAKSIGNIFKKK